MECNKDEAIRAKEHAEKKLQNNDFEGAQKIALKAQRLYPELDNISQLLAVCNVHCSAKKNMLGSEKDWYGILQVDRLADEVTVKKQFRRLALLLHPDKNNLPGAEAAFKLIGQANALISDRGKRSLYDLKCRVSNVTTPMKSPPPHLVNQEKSFWTWCPYCKVKYPCNKELMNRAMRCQSCGSPFIASNISYGISSGVQGEPLRTNFSQPSQHKGSPNKGTSKRASEATGFPSSHMESRECPSVRTVRPEEQMQGGSYPAGGTGFGVNSDCVRTSHRHKQEFSYNGTENDNNHESISKKARHSGLTGGSEVKQETCGHDSKRGNSANLQSAYGNHKAKTKQNKVSQEQNIQGKKVTNKKANGCIPYSTGKSANKIEAVIDLGSESSSDNVDNSASQKYDYPDTEFYDFDRGKEVGCFAADQVWACYDPADGMPRFYALIRKVLGPAFKVRFYWLEADPDDQGSIDWTEAELPVGCGKYKRGNTEETSDNLIFSHQVQWAKGKRGSCIIYPRKGEIWALFKDWDISWRYEADKHRSYKYEIVQVLSDFVEYVGIVVCYLNRMNGFVSLFQRTSQNEQGSPFFIKHNELYRFSHRIPSFRLSGTEREGVPEGSFELDPASLPQNPDDLWYPHKVEEVSRNGVPDVYNFSTKLNERNGKSVDFKDMNDACNEMSKVCKSPRGLNVNQEKPNQINASPRSIKESRSAHQCGSSANRLKYSSPFIMKPLSSKADFELPSPAMDTTPINSTNIPDKLGMEFFYDFSMDKLEGKFQVGQVWAIYGSNGELPMTYAQIKKIVSGPLRLHAVLLEVCSQTKNATRSVCGTFKVKNQNPQIFYPESFSHVVNVKFTRSRVEIYPQLGEIWALKSDPANHRYDIVEVREFNKDKIKVSTLVRVNGYKSVFRLQRSQLNDGVFELQQHEFTRFSHRIPAMQLTGEKGGALHGCWELDPDLVPGNV